MSTIHLTTAFIATAVLAVLWTYFKQLVLPSALDVVPGPPSGSLIYGNLKQILHKDGWSFIQHLTDGYPGVAKLHGPFGHRMLYVFDPVALHHIIVKEQHVYEETAWFIKFNLLRFGPGLLATLGDHHRRQRKMLNPVFSIAHMRQMVTLFNIVCGRLQTAIGARVSAGCSSGEGEEVELDMLAWMGRTALELIGQAGLGHSFDPLVADTPDEFAHVVKSFGPALVTMNHLRRALPYIPQVGPPALQRALVGMIPHDGIQRVVTFIDRMHAEGKKIYRAKLDAFARGDEAVAKQVGEGRDVMSILIRANTEAAEEDRLPEDEVVAQIATFIFAGMDTTSNALAMTLLLLGDHPDVQGKLRAEILEALGDRDALEYDELVALPYLDAVCRETLRLHPPVTHVFRETRKDTVLPLSTPITERDGRKVQSIMVPKDTTIVVGILSSNRNTAVWGADAMEWRPERWLAPLPESVTEAKVPGVYSNLMTFLGGGRACIGFKFSQLEMKAVLCLLLAKYTFAPSGKKISWNLSNVRFPTVGDDPKPSMPMKVALYKSSRSSS